MPERQRLNELRPRLQQTLHSIAGIFGQFDIRIRFIMLEFFGVPLSFIVNVLEILTESPTQPTHADMHPQVDALPPRQLAVERFGNESGDFFATEHGSEVRLCLFLMPAAFHAIRQL